MVDTFIRPDQRNQAAAPLGSNRARIRTMVVACMGVTLVIASMVALNTALGDIAVATSATQSQLTWIVDCYSVALACLLLPAGAIGDRYGRRGAFLVGLATFAIASLASTVFANPLQLVAARGVAGVGAAFIMPATLSLLTATYGEDERAKATGIWAGVAGSGAVIGMLGSGALLHFWSWRSIFWAVAASAALIFVLACTIKSSRDDEATPLDWPGAVLIAGTVAVFVFGMLEAPARGWSNRLIYGSMSIGAALAVAFGCVELRRRHPLLDVRLFRRPDFATGSATITVFFMAMFGFFFVIMQYIQLVMGYSPIQTAFALSPLMAPMLTLSVLSPWYLPRMGSTAGDVPRAAAHLGRVPVDAGPADRLAVLGRDVADARDEYRHRILHGTKHISDHDGGARREAGRRLGSQRHHPRGRGRPWRRAGRLYPRGAICPCPHPASGGVPGSGTRPGLPFAGSGRGDLQNAGPAWRPTRRTQPDRVPARDGIVAAGARPDRRRSRTGDRRLGARPRRTAAAPGPTNYVAPDVS
jgi:MFS family permease